MKTFLTYLDEYSNGLGTYATGGASTGPGLGQYVPIADLNAADEKEVKKSDLDQVEKYADRIFASLGIDVEFTRHFLDRVNDKRNVKQITPAELTRLFKQSFKKYGKKIAQLGPDAEAVINDMKTDINMPFVLNLKGGELELVAKTVMRKKDFKTSGPKMSFENYINEKRAKQAVSQGKVQKLVTAHGYSFKGKNYKEIDMELVGIDNSSQIVTFNIIHPKEIFGNEMKIPFKNLRRGRYMATDTSKINEILGKNADMGDYIDDFKKSDAPQFKGKSKDKRKDMAIAAFKSKSEDFTHYPGQVDSKKDQKDGDWVKGDPLEPIEFDGSDTKSILDKANKEVEKERKVKVKPFVESNMEFYQLDEKIEGLVTKAKKSGMPYGILKKVYDRGMAAWKTGHRPGTTPQQWAFARVNSFVTKSSGTWGKADKDLAKQVNSSHHPEETELGMIPKKKTKGHEVLGPESVQEWFESNMTRASYQLRHGDDWWWKLQEVKESMLEKMGVCCDDCADGVHEAKGPCWDNYKQVGMKMKGGKEVPNCVPESMTQEEFDEALKKVKGTSNLYEPRKKSKYARTKSMMDYMKTRDKNDADKSKGDKAKGDYRMRMYNSMENAWGEMTEKDDKSGKELNNPTRGDVKKYKVYVKNDKGNVVKVEFGDPNMSIKRDDPARRKNFRARHNCDQKKDKTTAGYWSCKFWSGKSVTDLMKG